MNLCTVLWKQIDVAMVTVSPPDKHGFCSLGTSVDVTRAALQNANIIVAFVNNKMPRTLGDGIIHQSHFNYMVHGDVALPSPKDTQISDVENKIGEHIANYLVSDGATLQM